MHRYRRMAHGGRQHHVAVGETLAARQQHLALFEIEPGAADVPAGRRGRVDDHALAVARGVLLDHDGVGAGRDHAAGEDARGLAGMHLALERMTGCDLARDLERHRHACHVRGAHRIAVHGREIGGRLGPPRRDVRRQHPAVGVGQGCVFARQRLDAVEHAGERVGHRQQRRHAYSLDLRP